MASTRTRFSLQSGALSWVWGLLRLLVSEKQSGTQLGPRGLFRRVRSLWLKIFKTIERASGAGHSSGHVSRASSRVSNLSPIEVDVFEARLKPLEPPLESRLKFLTNTNGHI